MKVLLDLNVALDVVLNRQPWVADSLHVWNAHQAGQIEGWLAATALTNMFYIVRRIGGAAKAQLAVRSCLATFGVVPVERSTLEEAARQLGADFEDNVNIACAIVVGIDVIVTRDPAGYLQSPIPVASPAELISRLSTAK